MYYKYFKQRFGAVFAPGIKMPSNGLPLKLDTHNNCINACRYCYASELRASTLGRVGIKQNPQVARLLDVVKLGEFFEKSYKHQNHNSPFMSWAVREKKFIELGTTGETFQEADLFFRTTYNFFKLASEFEMPVFINTKMNLLCRSEEYRKLLINHKAPIIICLTLTTVDDKLGKLYEPLAPLPSERLRTVKELSQYDNIKTIVYISPFMPGVTDREPEEYTKAMIDAGVIGAHLRDFYIQGKVFQSSFWQKYIKENSRSLQPFPFGHHASYESRKNFFLKVHNIAKSMSSSFRIVGMKSKWFELNPYHGKMCYDVLPDKFKDGITDFTAIPIMRKIRENKEVPQLLLWSNLGYKKGLINLPDKIRTNEGRINNLMEGICNCNTSDVTYEMDGYDWLVGSLWNGWKGEKPEGFFNGLDYIYPVKDKGRYLKENGNFIYVYLPKDNWDMIVDGGKTYLFNPHPSKMQSPYVDYSNCKGFIVPERIGGTEDKFYEKE